MFGKTGFTVHILTFFRENTKSIHQITPDKQWNSFLNPTFFGYKEHIWLDAYP